MVADTIQADYEALDQIVSKFTERCDAMQQMMQNIQSKYDPLISDGWKGDAATTFANEMQDEIFPACNRLHEAMAEAAETTRKLSQTISSSEQECANQFQIR